MPIGVTNPIDVKPKQRSAHKTSTPRVHTPHTTKSHVAHAHTPAIHHVRAPKAPHAPRIPHARTQHGITPAEAATGRQDNANLMSALNGGHYGTAAQVNNPGAGKPWTGAYDAYGLPTGPGSGRTGLRVVQHNFATLGQAIHFYLVP